MILEECFVGRREGVTESLSQAIPPLIRLYVCRLAGFLVQVYLNVIQATACPSVPLLSCAGQ